MLLVSGGLAVGAAACVAFGSMLTAELVRYRLSLVGFCAWRLGAATLITVVLATLDGGWASLTAAQLWPLAISGLVGLVVGELAFNGSILLIGPQRAMLVFALNAPLTAGLGFLTLGEAVAPSQLAGIALVITGVALAIFFGAPGGAGRRPEPRIGAVALAQGIACGLIAGGCQTVNLLMTRPIMEEHPDPVAALAVRVGSAALVFALLARSRLPFTGPRAPFSWPVIAIAAASAAIGIALGMALLLAALVDGNVAIVSTLASMTPIVILPMIWLRTGTAPSWRAWSGAALASIGTGLIFIA